MIRLKNKQTGLEVEAPTGYSFTTLAFGFFVPAIRGMYGYAAIWAFVGILTSGISWFFLPFFINKAYVKFLIEKGYAPMSDRDTTEIIAAGISYASTKEHETKAA